MVNMKEVQNILQIPTIENYVDSIFLMKVYDVDDNTIIYNYKDFDYRIQIEVCVICEPLKYINGSLKGFDLFTIENCVYFSFAVFDLDTEERKSMYHYRKYQ